MAALRHERSFIAIRITGVATLWPGYRNTEIVLGADLLRLAFITFWFCDKLHAPQKVRATFNGQRRHDRKCAPGRALSRLNSRTARHGRSAGPSCRSTRSS